MRTHTNDYKTNIKEFAREIDTKITYILNNEEIELGSSELNSVSLHYEGSILKSVMKQLDIDSNTDIPLKTILTAQFGVKVEDEYEYITLGQFVVKTSEKQEDTNSYKLTCYDKMLYSMKEYKGLVVSYPITIRNYLASICSYLEIGFASSSDTFANYDKEIAKELYLGQDYTFRDVLDEIAQATASTICINDSGNLEVRYINNTNDTINEDYFKNINVNFGEKYGPINSIVLSRSGESDNVYLQDDESIELNGLCEIKIVDNQIMNWNDRSDYLADILDKLDGLEYYLNDFSSPGITYYDVCDKYNVSIGNNTYSCIMFNDEINITQGLEENIHTDLPIQSETDYTKADKTDRKINQVYLIVDKQNGTIESLVSAVGEQSTQISTITQTVDNLSLQVEDVNDGTTSASSRIASVSLEKVAESSPVYIDIYPIIEDISYTYPYKLTYPSNTTYLKIKKLRFTNTTTSATFDYDLPYDLFYYNNVTYDEFILDSENEVCKIIRRVGFDANGDKYALDEEIIVTLTYPTINLTAGNYTVELIGYTSGYLKVRLEAVVKWATKAELVVTSQSILSTVSSTYATKTELGDEVTELNSTISQTASEINIEVAKKENKTDNTAAKIVAKINNAGSSVQIEADHIDLSGKTIALTSDSIAISSTNFNVDTNGNVTMANGKLTGGSIHLLNESDSFFSYLFVGSPTPGGPFSYGDEFGAVQDHDLSVCKYPYYGILEPSSFEINGSSFYIQGDNLGLLYNANSTSQYIKITDDVQNAGSYMTYAGMWSAAYNNTSLESLKKNIEFDNGCLEQILNTDIVNYNWKFEDDGDKKHIGLIIPDEGGNYKYAEKVLTHDRDAVDLYSATMMSWKAIQEQQEIINQLKQEIKSLKGEI